MKDILLRLDNKFILRLNKAVEDSPFTSRMEFIRYLLDKALTQYENDAR